MELKTIKPLNEPIKVLKCKLAEREHELLKRYNANAIERDYYILKYKQAIEILEEYDGEL